MNSVQSYVRILQTLLFLISCNATSATYVMPLHQGDSLIGDDPEKPFFTKARQEDTLLDIARRFNLGQNEIVLLNPDVDRWLPGEGTKVQINNSRILPDSPKNGMTLNLPEYRLYYYHTAPEYGLSLVATYPVSIGRQDWNTPLGKTKVIAKTKDPQWRPPESVKKEHAARGDILPDVVPAGPDNPLGQYAMRLGIPGYLIHGTNKPYGVGMRVSHGCVRMYPEDIENMFPDIKIKTPVYIVNQPIKVGWLNDTLYIEVHPPLEDEHQNYEELLESALNLIEKANDNQIPVVNGAALKKVLTEHTGIPTAIYTRPQNETANENDTKKPDAETATGFF